MHADRIKWAEIAYIVEGQTASGRVRVSGDVIRACAESSGDFNRVHYDAAPAETPEGNIIIEDDLALGSGVHFYVDNHRYDRIDIPIKSQGYYPSREVRVCRGACTDE